MTIKQQGGIFGRNPTFNDVDVEGTLTVNGEPISDFGSMAQQDADSVNIDGGAIDGVTLGTNSAATEAQIDNVNINGNTIKATDTNGDLIINPDGTSGVVLTAKTRTGVSQRTLNKTMNEWGGQGNGVGFENTARYEITAGNDTVKAFLAAGYNSAGKYPNVGAVGTTSNHPLAIHINDNKVAEFTTSGNLAFNNGLGIDFSATSGTGTSELFSDYEEGSWTPQYTNTTPPTTPYTMDIVSADYVKIGNTVFITANIRTDSVNTSGALGALRISGLPFTCGSSSGIVSVSGAVDWGGDFPSSGYVNPSSTQIILRYRSSANGATLESNAADLTSGATANQNTLQFSAIYTV